MSSPSPAATTKKDKFRPVCCDFLAGHCVHGASTCPNGEHADVTAKPCHNGEGCKFDHYHRHWVPDEEFEHCNVCKKKFTVFTMTFRHHCRYDGKVVCGNCLVREFKPWPVCVKCARDDGDAPEI